MKRPSFQFYPADWRNNAKLRRCSEAARGAWVDVLCVLHDSDDYGVCRWPLVELARAAGAPLKLLKELVSKDVLKGADSNATPYIFTPRHAGKDGEPVVLVAVDAGPCWYCSRFVRDEYIRQRRGQSTRFDASNQPPKNAPKATPMPPIGGRQGDGPTSSSTSKTYSVPNGTGGEPPEPPSAVDMIFALGLPLLTASGVQEKQARTMLGMLRKQHGDDATVKAIQQCVDDQAVEPVGYLQRVLRTQPKPSVARPEPRNEAYLNRLFDEPSRRVKDMGVIDASTGQPI